MMSSVKLIMRKNLVIFSPLMPNHSIIYIIEEGIYFLKIFDEN